MSLDDYNAHDLYLQQLEVADTGIPVPSTSD